MYAEDLGFLFCIRRAFSFAGKPLRWQVNLDRTTSDMRNMTPVQEPEIAFCLYTNLLRQHRVLWCFMSIQYYLLLWFVMRVCPTTWLLQVGQLRPRYARWRQASWAGKARCWTWSYWCGNPKTSKASWIGLLVFWSFQVRLIHCDSRDLEYTIKSTLAYQECCRQSRIGYSTAQGVRSASSQKQKEALEKIQDWTDRSMNLRARFEASYPRVYSLHPRLFLGTIWSSPLKSRMMKAYHLTVKHKAELWLSQMSETDRTSWFLEFPW